MDFYELHPHLDAVELYLNQILPAEEASQIEDHLSGCRQCKEMAAQLRRAIEITAMHSPTEVGLVQ